MNNAFVYIWTHIPTLKWYAGSRTAINCAESDGYICSSKIVKPLILAHPEEWIRTIVFVGSPADAILFEAELLEIMDAKNDIRSYNMHNGDGNFTTAGIALSQSWRNNISKSNTGKKRSAQSIENYKKSNQQKTMDPLYITKLKKPKPLGHGANVSAALKGKKKTIEHCQAMSLARKGKSTGPCSDSRKDAIRNALKGKHTLPLITCPHCGLEGRANMKRWHFDNCKNKL